MREYPMPMPFGWFQVAWSHEVAPGESMAASAYGKHLAIWRSEDGDVRLWDAFCPHLGSHLGVRSKVCGDSLRCALHRWTFSSNGICENIPYSPKVNRSARVRTYDVVEVNGCILGWFHPLDEPPMWENQPFPEFREGSGYSEVFTHQYSLNCHWQEIAETQVDAAHIQAHLLEYQEAFAVDDDAVVPTPPAVESYTTNGPFASMRLQQDFPTPKGASTGRIDTDIYGPGVAITRFTGLVDTALIGCATPTGPASCDLRFSFVVKSTGDAQETSSLGKAFIDEIHERTAEDVEIWENKAYVPKPALALGDGPIKAFRSWCEQFYVGGVRNDTDPWVPDIPSTTSM